MAAMSIWQQKLICVSGASLSGLVSSFSIEVKVDAWPLTGHLRRFIYVEEGSQRKVEKMQKVDGQKNPDNEWALKWETGHLLNLGTAFFGTTWGLRIVRVVVDNFLFGKESRNQNILYIVVEW